MIYKCKAMVYGRMRKDNGHHCMRYALEGMDGYCKRHWPESIKRAEDQRKIAAHDDLLAALKDEISDMTRISVVCQDGLMERCGCSKCRMKRSREAIAKAEGQS